MEIPAAVVERAFKKPKSRRPELIKFFCSQGFKDKSGKKFSDRAIAVRLAPFDVPQLDTIKSVYNDKKNRDGYVAARKYFFWATETQPTNEEPKQKTKMKTFRNHRAQIVGWLTDDKIFRKEVSKKKHLFKKEDAWGIDKAVLEQLPENCEIRIKDKDEDIVYFTSKERFLTGFEVDFGHGAQITMWRGLFDTKGADGVLHESPHIERWLEQWQMFEDAPRHAV